MQPEPHLLRDNYYAWNNLTNSFGFDAAGCIAHMAAQQTMGILSKRWAWPGAVDGPHSTVNWPSLDAASIT